MKLTKEMLIDWIDRPPSNSDLDLINYIIDLQNNRDKAIEFIHNIYFRIDFSNLYNGTWVGVKLDTTSQGNKLLNILKGDSDD